MIRRRMSAPIENRDASAMASPESFAKVFFSAGQTLTALYTYKSKEDYMHMINQLSLFSLSLTSASRVVASQCVQRTCDAELSSDGRCIMRGQRADQRMSISPKVARHW